MNIHNNSYKSCMYSQSECNANKTSDTEIDNIANKVEQSNESSDETKSKSPSGRFAKRNYRKRSDSQSSTNSVPMEATSSEQTRKPLNERNVNNLEVNSFCFVFLFNLIKS